MSDVLDKVLKIFPYLDPETQQEILRMTREFMAKAAKADDGPLPQSAVEAMAKAVPDQLMADVVKDLRHGPGQPGSWASEPNAPKQPVVRGTGWHTAKNEDRTNQFKLMDAIVDHLAGGPNDTSKLR